VIQAKVSGVAGYFGDYLNPEIQKGGLPPKNLAKRIDSVIELARAFTLIALTKELDDVVEIGWKNINDQLQDVRIEIWAEFLRAVYWYVISNELEPFTERHDVIARSGACCQNALTHALLGMASGQRRKTFARLDRYYELSGMWRAQCYGAIAVARVIRLFCEERSLGMAVILPTSSVDAGYKIDLLLEASKAGSVYICMQIKSIREALSTAVIVDKERLQRSDTLPPTSFGGPSVYMKTYRAVRAFAAVQGVHCIAAVIHVGITGNVPWAIGPKNYLREAVFDMLEI